MNPPSGLPASRSSGVSLNDDPAGVRRASTPGRWTRSAGGVAALTVLSALPLAAQEPPDTAAAEPGVVRVEGLMVTSTRTGQRVQDEPLRVEILGQEEIVEKALMTPGNIAMLLNETGGLRVQVTSPSLGAANIRVQGLRGRYTQLLADGLPLYGGQAGSIGLLQIPPTDLGQVEVIKGVASALYGASAMGGVVNLVSRRPGDEPGVDLLFNASSQNGQDVTAYADGPLSGGWGWSVVGGGHRQSRQDLDGEGWADVPGHERFLVRPRLFWDGGGGRSVFLTAGAMTESREGGTLPGRTLPGGPAFPEALDTDRFDAGITARLPVGGVGFLGVRGSGMVQDHRHRFGDRLEDDRHGTAFGEVALSGATGRHSWVIGGAVSRDVYRSDSFSDFDYTFTVPGLFAQDEIGLTPDLRASASVRWDAHSEYGSHVSPRVSVLYRPGPWTARASVGGGFFGPTPFVEEIEAAGLARLERIDGLEAERAWTGSLDLGRTFGGLEWNATLFGSRIEDAVHLRTVDLPGVPGDAQAVRLVNVEGTTRTVGAELLVRHRWEAITLTGSYVHVDATEPDPDGGARREIPLTPRHTAGLVGMWEDHERGLLGIEAYYTGAQPLEDDPSRSRGKPYVHLGVLGELRRGMYSVFLNFENILNVRQTRWDPLVRDTRAPDGRWTVDAWAPTDGFALNGGVRIRWGGEHEEGH